MPVLIFAKSIKIREIRDNCYDYKVYYTLQIRGALNAIQKLKEERTGPVTAVTHSSGNHGQALALAAKLANIRAHVIVPTISPQSKKDAIAGYGAEIHESEPTAEVSLI